LDKSIGYLRNSNNEGFLIMAGELNCRFVAFTRLACPALGRGAPLLFSFDEKSNKKIKSAKRLLCAHGICPAKLIKPRAA
jgi:hypothetical protein